MKARNGSPKRTKWPRATVMAAGADGDSVARRDGARRAVSQRLGARRCLFDASAPRRPRRGCCGCNNVRRQGAAPSLRHARASSTRHDAHDGAAVMGSGAQGGAPAGDRHRDKAGGVQQTGVVAAHLAKHRAGRALLHRRNAARAQRADARGDDEHIDGKSVAKRRGSFIRRAKLHLKRQQQRGHCACERDEPQGRSGSTTSHVCQHGGTNGEHVRRAAVHPPPDRSDSTQTEERHADPGHGGGAIAVLHRVLEDDDVSKLALVLSGDKTGGGGGGGTGGAGQIHGLFWMRLEWGRWCAKLTAANGARGRGG
ncbi:hypothetical protein FGB62_7g671 [Gracilaria domingensis]|nr:hypothetical protein FGB62_7g671 [Gracilaria domingensis]